MYDIVLFDFVVSLTYLSDVHLTNVAIQKTAPVYDPDVRDRLYIVFCFLTKWMSRYHFKMVF